MQITPTGRYMRRVHIEVLLLGLWMIGTSVWGQTRTQPARSNPTYSNAVYMGKEPSDLLVEAEATVARDSARQWGGIAALAYAAKAALEAGENKKARGFAERALKLADAYVAARPQYSDSDHARSRNGVPAADYYANFVLGRLALVDGDVRSAEQFLLASGRTAGDATLSSYGPNLSLALELLKRGDDGTWTVVAQFVDQLKSFWRVSPSPFDGWKRQIAERQIPDFQAVGPNLYN
jgi:hypothetical protein